MIHLVRITSEICEDSYQHGMGKCTGAGLNERVGKTFEDKKEMIKWLHNHYHLPKDENGYEENDFNRHPILETQKMVSDKTEYQNGGWMEPTKEEYALWKKGQMTLYTESYMIEYLEVMDKNKIASEIERLEQRIAAGYATNNRGRKLYDTKGYKAGEKDLWRMRDMKVRAKGSEEKLVALARQMANSIRDASKAFRRADAAQQIFDGEKFSDKIVSIFMDAGFELSGSKAAKVAAVSDAEYKKFKKEWGAIEDYDHSVRGNKPGVVHIYIYESRKTPNKFRSAVESDEGLELVEGVFKSEDDAKNAAENLALYFV